MTFYERSRRPGALRAYKPTLSPLIGRQCRFLPTCSEYAAQALITPRSLARLLARGRAVVPMPSLGRLGLRPVRHRAKGPQRRARPRKWTCET